jgi:hypothetical protein
MRRSVVPPALLAGLLIAALPLGDAPATAAAPPLVQRLISASQASKLGFPKVAKKATSSHKTGVKTCHTGAEVAYQENGHPVGLVAEVFTCNSPAAAKSVLTIYERTYEPTATLPPPAVLGKSAVGSATAAPLYVFFWTRGSFVGFVGVDTDAASTKAQYEVHLRDPRTPAELSALEQAAVEENAKLG